MNTQTDSQKELQKMVNRIAAELSSGELDCYCEEGEQPSVYDWLKDSLDIEYIIGGNREYLGARILVSFGGPNVWVNTRTNTVEGYWWADSAFASFDDNVGLDDAVNELWECC